MFWNLTMLVDFHATKYHMRTYFHLCVARNTVAQKAAPERKSCQSNCHQWPEPNLGHVFPSANQCINAQYYCTCSCVYMHMLTKLHTRDGGFVDTTLGTGTWSLCDEKIPLSLTFLFITSCLKDLIESTGMQQRHLVVCNLGTLDVLWNRLAVVDKRIKAKIQGNKIVVKIVGHVPRGTFHFDSNPLSTFLEGHKL